MIFVTLLIIFTLFCVLISQNIEERLSNLGYLGVIPNELYENDLFDSLKSLTEKSNIETHYNDCNLIEKQCYPNYIIKNDDFNSLINYLQSHNDDLEFLRVDIAFNSFMYETYEYFTKKNPNTLLIDPKFIFLNGISTLIPVQKTIFLNNLSKNFDILLTFIKSDDYQIQIMNNQPNEIIKKGKKIRINIKINPLLKGDLNSRLYFFVNLINIQTGKITKKIIIYDIICKIIENKYGIKPITIRDKLENFINKLDFYLLNPNNEKIVIFEAFLTENETITLSLPTNNIEKLDIDYQNKTSNYLYYNYFEDDIKTLWEIKSKAKKNILELKFQRIKEGTYFDYLTISIDKYESFEIPIFIEAVDGMYFERENINFAINIDNNKFLQQIDLKTDNLKDNDFEIVDIINLYNKEELILDFFPFSNLKPIYLPSKTKSFTFGSLILKVLTKKNSIINSLIIILYKNTVTNQKYYKMIEIKVFNTIRIFDITDIQFSLDYSQNSFLVILRSLFKFFISRGNPFIMNPDTITLNGLKLTLKMINFQTKNYTMFYNHMKLNFSLNIMKLDINYNEKNFVYDKVNTVFLNFKLAFFDLPFAIHFFPMKLICSIYQILTNFENKLLYKQICSKLLWDLRFVKINETRKYELFIENPNPSKILIFQFKSDNLSQINFEYPSVENSFTLKKNEFIKIILYYIPKSEKYLEGIFSFKSSLNESFQIKLLAQPQRGSLTFSPSLIRFEPGFPHFIQKQIVYVRSSFHKDFLIKQVKSSDQRIYPILINDRIIADSRSLVLYIIFDPEVPKNHNYTLDPMLKLKDVFLWQINRKERLETKIDVNISINTDIIQFCEIKIKTYLTNPKITDVESLDFGVNFIGGDNFKNLTIYNPSDKVLDLVIFLKEEDFGESKYFDRILKMFYDEEIDRAETTIICLNEEMRINMDFYDNILGLFIDVFEELEIKKLENSYIIKKINMNQREKLVSFNSLTNVIGENYRNEFLNISSFYCIKGNAKPIISRMIIKHKEFLNKLYKYWLTTEEASLMDWIFSEEASEKLIIDELNTTDDNNSTNFELFLYQFCWFFTFFNIKCVNYNKITNNPFTIDTNKRITILPHETYILSNIMFNPTKPLFYKRNLVIKNNLTGISVIELKGMGSFVNLRLKSYCTKFHCRNKLNNKQNDIFLKFIIKEDDFINYQGFFFRNFTFINEGPLNLYGVNFYIDNNGCFGKFFSILFCEEIFASPGDLFTITIIYKPELKNRINEKLCIFDKRGTYLKGIKFEIKNLEYFKIFLIDYYYGNINNLIMNKFITVFIIAFIYLYAYFIKEMRIFQNMKKIDCSNYEKFPILDNDFLKKPKKLDINFFSIQKNNNQIKIYKSLDDEISNNSLDSPSKLSSDELDLLIIPDELIGIHGHIGPNKTPNSKNNIENEKNNLTENNSDIYYDYFKYNTNILFSNKDEFIKMKNKFIDQK